MLLRAAYLGFSKAQLKMAQAYELCQLGCEFEPALSLHYNALAARQNEAEADMAISKWFLCGYEGIFEKNEELAFTYAKRAASTKMPTAEFAMGYFYEIGMYVQVDLEESAAWYSKSAEHGNKDALGRIDSIRKNSTLSKTDHEQVAISRIKSQHGSQRGGRPDRFKQRGAALPVIVDDAMDMPDPRNKYDGTGQLRQPGALPARPKSTAPYPEDDVAHPGSFSNGPNGPFNGQGLRPHSQQMAPLADRASSPFGIKPPQHSSTMGLPAGGMRADERLRPSSSMGNMQHVPAGRGHDPQGRAGVVSSGWDTQGAGRGRQASQQSFLPPVDADKQSQLLSTPANLNPHNQEDIPKTQDNRLSHKATAIVQTPPQPAEVHPKQHPIKATTAVPSPQPAEEPPK
ncbi:putative Chitin synthase regulatory factor 4 [Glarea lozoyensis 74030]|uniref:Putative Chitin synthase regulatory factor 4 n=1 Tax=Glarea lozoyensis (strain ATCC 74030 / MF5533) TaxID=1104152 RepID=H0EUN4_GLAL7|nr:putative Chitin synthase regulatory factor 4 [Glarea lozoyensis 74030]